MKLKYVNAGLAALMLFGLGTGNAIAAENQPITGNIASLSCDLIDPQKEVTLTLEKTGDNPNNAGEHVVIEGAQFNIKRVQGINLKDNCEQAKKLTIEEAQKLGFDKEFTTTTDSAGKTSITLPGGLYLIEEVAPSNTTQKYRISSPQLMFLPTGNVTGTAWQYETVRVVKGTTPTPTPSEPVTPTPSEPVTPTPSEPVTPTPSEPVTPTPSEPVTPTPSEPVTPTPSESVTPTPSEPATQTPSEPAPSNPAPSTPATPSERNSALAYTGASIGGFLLLGTGLTFIGMAILRKRRSSQTR